MCLDRLIGDGSVPEEMKTGTGYKVFMKGQKGALYGDFFAMKSPRPEGQWIKAKDFQDPHALTKGKKEIPLFLMPDQSYKPGWHIFCRRFSAEMWRVGKSQSGMRCVIRKVRYRGATALGEQSGAKTIIADEMFIKRGIIE